jgi:hypothetical protein
MSKKALIAVSLVKESMEMSNEEIEQEILEEIQKWPLATPWVEKVLNVRVTEV